MKNKEAIKTLDRTLDFYQVTMLGHPKLRSAVLSAMETYACGWVSVTDALPEILQTVWITNGRGWVALGCRIAYDEGWHWGESNGVIYQENGEIVSECESDDLDVVFWHELPKPPTI